MISEDSTFIDLSLINEENKKKKCKLPQCLKDLLNICIPAILVIGGLTLICLLL
tara:strand:- start:1021 stop:1182 length:162 start_codon:yes stop_codon:yes gene_type:complete